MMTLRELLQSIYERPMTIQSDTARAQAAVVAMAASLGLITTQLSPHKFGRAWRITNRGLLLLNEDEDQ